MATATAKPSGTTFVLELSEAEAQYVEAALCASNPVHLDGDPVWKALYNAMTDAGVADDETAAVTGVR